MMDNTDVERNEGLVADLSVETKVTSAGDADDQLESSSLKKEIQDEPAQNDPLEQMNPPLAEKEEKITRIGDRSDEAFRHQHH